MSDQSEEQDETAPHAEEHYQAPMYLERQAGQSRPLSPYFSRRQRTRWVTAGAGTVLSLCMVFACLSMWVGPSQMASDLAIAMATATVPATDTTTSQGGQGAQQVATVAVAATDTPAPATPTEAATDTPVPPTATPAPQAQPTCIPGAVNCNPWGYNFSPGNLISRPPSQFCAYFACIAG